jgi:hypothetical protein
VGKNSARVSPELGSGVVGSLLSPGVDKVLKLAEKILGEPTQGHDHPPPVVSDGCPATMEGGVKSRTKPAHPIRASTNAPTTIYQLHDLLGRPPGGSLSGIIDECSMFLSSTNIFALLLVHGIIYSPQVINFLKLFVASCLKAPIVWWPWEPPLGAGSIRVYWTCVCLSPCASTVAAVKA